MFGNLDIGQGIFYNFNTFWVFLQLDTHFKRNKQLLQFFWKLFLKKLHTHIAA